jgi:hypothetical protein
LKEDTRGDRSDRKIGRRRSKLLDDLKERRWYSHLKEEALDRNMWRAGFGRGFGPVVRQTAKWNESELWESECFKKWRRVVCMCVFSFQWGLLCLFLSAYLLTPCSTVLLEKPTSNFCS